MTSFFFCRMWLNFCLSLSLTCAMFITVSSLLYNTMTFIFTSTFTSVSKPKIGLRKKSVFCVLLHNMCDFVPNLRLLFSFSRCTTVYSGLGQFRCEHTVSDNHSCVYCFRLFILCLLIMST